MGFKKWSEERKDTKLLHCLLGTIGQILSSKEAAFIVFSFVVCGKV